MNEKCIFCRKCCICAKNNVILQRRLLLENKDMVNLQKNNVEILPEGYSEWRKDIEELIEVSKLRTALNVKHSAHV